MPVDTLVSALVTLLVVVDPIGLAPIFLALTEGMTNAARRRVAARASLIALCVLAGFALAGRWLLAQLGITLPAFRIAGGLLLFAIAFEMVYGRRSDRAARDHPGGAGRPVRDRRLARGAGRLSLTRRTPPGT
jgi:multiple antibiotic resistance protein